MRNFVLYPIKQIDPNWIHPVLKQNINYLIKKLDFKSRIEITRLSKNVNIKL
jgi:7,8-dihydro-6-hydroxymethylpterin-pyrophosphokinase